MIFSNNSDRWMPDDEYYSTGYGTSSGGSATSYEQLPFHPNASFTPEGGPLPRVWEAFFAEMRRIVQDHINNQNIHRVR